MGTHNLCFEAKIRKIGIPMHTPVFLYNSGYKGVYIARTCFPDVSVRPASVLCSILCNYIMFYNHHKYFCTSYLPS